MSFTGVASISWNDLQQIRVYGIDKDSELVEWQWMNDGKWHGPGKINAKADRSKPISATNSGARLRVYYYGLDGKLNEQVYEGSSGWVKGAVMPSS